MVLWCYAITYYGIKGVAAEGAIALFLVGRADAHPYFMGSVSSGSASAPVR